MPSPDFEKLERLIHENLRALPGREAPRTLETRVLMALERRAALPWWRRSYIHWPVGLRCAFILLLAAAAAAVLAFSGSQVPAQAASELALRFPWISFLHSIGANLWETGGLVFDAIPAAWLYGGVAVLVLCYALLFGLGAAAYRAFIHPRQRLFRPLSS